MYVKPYVRGCGVVETYVRVLRAIKYIEASDDWLSKVLGVCQSSLFFIFSLVSSIVLKMEPDNFNISLCVYQSRLRSAHAPFHYATSALHGTVVPSHGAAHSHAAAARGLWVEGSPGARGLKRYQPEQQIGSPYLRVGGSVSLSRA